jgi:hypothetical protein
MPFQPPQPGTTGRIQTPATGVAPVEVTGSDVDGVVVSIQPPAMITGRVRIDGPTAATGSQLRVALQPDPRGNLNSGLPSPALVQPDGSFQLENVAPGDYQVSVPTGTPAGATGLNSSAAFYVKEARFGSTDILTEPLVIAGPTTTELQLVLGTNAGQITGTVTDDSQQAASRVQMILLVPDRRERRDLYKTGGTDPNGRFTIRSVAPGSYTAYAVDPNNFALIFDPVLNAKAQPKGQHITVGESSNLTVDLVVVAPPK